MGGGGQGGCECRIEVFGRIKKKKKNLVGGGGSGGLGQEGGGGVSGRGGGTCLGVRVDVNEELNG